MSIHYLCALVLLLGATADASEPDRIHPTVADTSRATPGLVHFLNSYFAAKNTHDVSATMAHVAEQGFAGFKDATLGGPMRSYADIYALFRQLMPKWPATARSYPTWILGDERSALIAFTDTPEMFGGEIRTLTAVDMTHGKIVRWIDYWDGRAFGTERLSHMRAAAADFPKTFNEDIVGENASKTMRTVVAKLHAALSSGDASAVAQLLSYDAVYEDMALRAQILGKLAIERYLARILPDAPYGTGSRLRHVLGSDAGGGFEWFPNPTSHVRAGITAVVLDQRGLVNRLTTVYDSSLLTDGEMSSLVSKAVE
jgi:hypothetical protein